MATPDQPSGPETPDEKIEKLTTEVAELKKALGDLTGSMHSFTRMLFQSGGKGLDEYPKRDVIFALEKTMDGIRKKLGMDGFYPDR